MQCRGRASGPNQQQKCSGVLRQTKFSGERKLCVLELCRIDDVESVESRKRCHLMRAHRSSAHDVFDAYAADEQRVANERAMAAPRHRFGTHDRGALCARELEQALQAVTKFFAAHIIGVAAKGSVTPAEIHGIVLRVTKPAEIFEVHVLDSLFAQRSGERIGIELRNAPRFRDAADVHETFDTVPVQDGQKFFDRARRMPDGEHC